MLLIIKTARELGVKVSLISNASRLTDDLMQKISPHLSLLGLSLDSGDSDTNKLIGRVDNKGRLLVVDEVQRMIKSG